MSEPELVERAAALIRASGCYRRQRGKQRTPSRKGVKTAERSASDLIAEHVDGFLPRLRIEQKALDLVWGAEPKAKSRPVWSRMSDAEKEKVRRLYVDEGQGINEVARRVGRASKTVRRVLHSMDIDTRPGRRRVA